MGTFHTSHFYLHALVNSKKLMNFPIPYRIFSCILTQYVSVKENLHFFFCRLWVHFSAVYVVTIFIWYLLYYVSQFCAVLS